MAHRRSDGVHAGDSFPDAVGTANLARDTQSLSDEIQCLSGEFQPDAASGVEAVPELGCLENLSGEKYRIDVQQEICSCALSRRSGH